MRVPTVKHTETVIDHKACAAMIRERREAKGKSLRWLAAKLKITPPYLSDLELGRRNWSEARFKEAMDILFEA